MLPCFCFLECFLADVNPYSDYLIEVKLRTEQGLDMWLYGESTTNLIPAARVTITNIQILLGTENQGLITPISVTTVHTNVPVNW